MRNERYLKTMKIERRPGCLAMSVAVVVEFLGDFLSGLESSLAFLSS